MKLHSKKKSTDEPEEKGLTVCLSRSRFTPVPSYVWFNLWFVFFWKGGFKGNRGSWVISLKAFV